MSVQDALKFIKAVRRNEKLKTFLLSDTSDLKAVTELGANEGYHFSEAELREAFKHDWAMRWFKHTVIPNRTKSD